MPLPRRFRFHHIAALCVALLLSGCGDSNGDKLSLAVVGEPGDPFTSGVRLPLAAQLVRGAAFEGLVAFDEQGRVVPGLADRWIVTDDGQSYLFRLRDGTWPDGSDLTGQSARQALERAIKALKKTTLGLDLAGIEEIRVMAGRVVEIRLVRPMPYLLQILAQPELGLVHDGKDGDEGGGPMLLKQGDGVAALTPIEPGKLGEPDVPDWTDRTRKLDLRALPGPQAIAAFNAGEVDLVLGGRLQDFPETSSVGLLRGTIQLDPVTGLFGLQAMNAEGFLADPQHREALAMAIDRDALIKPFGVDGWQPTTRLVAPSLEGDAGLVGERWADLTLEERRAVALRRVLAWHGDPALVAPTPGRPGAATPAPAPLVTLAVALPPGQGSDLLFARIAADFAAIRVRAVRARPGETGDLALVDDVARYPRAGWFLNRLSCAARRGLCNSQADSLMKEAAVTQNPSLRAGIVAQAETVLTTSNVYIPLGAPVRWSLVRGSVSGFATNAWGWHPLMPLAILPK